MPRLHAADLLNREVLAWRGLHLFHYAMSSCSQKLRIYLRLKDLAWESHIVDLSKQQNNEPWFMGINPRGLVPVLVWDGEVHIESNDIIRHLECQHPEPVLIPSNLAADIDRRLEEEDELHLALRTLSFRFVYGRRGSTKSEQALERMRTGGSATIQGQPDRGLAKEIDFYERLDREGLSDAMCQSAFERFQEAFGGFERDLEGQPFLLGESLTVLDIAWFVYAFRLDLAGYPLARLHPRVHRWFESLSKRPGFVDEVTPSGATRELIARSLDEQHASGRAFEQTILL